MNIPKNKAPINDFLVKSASFLKLVKMSIPKVNPAYIVVRKIATKYIVNRSRPRGMPIRVIIQKKIAAGPAKKNIAPQPNESPTFFVRFLATLKVKFLNMPPITKPTIRALSRLKIKPSPSP